MEQQKQIQRLMRALFLSGAFNIILLATFFYLLIKEAPPHKYCELKPTEISKQRPLAIEKTTEEIIRTLRALSMEHLIARLNNSQLVENGFTHRDLALAVLVSSWHFDLTRALAGYTLPSQQRSIPAGNNRKGQPITLTVYPGLSEQHFQAIIQFTQTERWPLTSRGLFLLLQKQLYPNDSSLTDTFFLTTEFLAVETLISRSEIKVSKQELLKMILEGNWTILSLLAEEQRLSQDLSPARRQRFLLDYIAHKSSTAAHLFLKTDEAFATRKLDDHQSLIVLSLLNEKTTEAEKFATLLLTSPRSDAVRQAAAQKLYDFAGESKPQDDLYQAAIERFVPTVATLNPPTQSKKSVTVENLKKTRSYTVQDGDSLWKIAKRHKISTEALRKHNKLTKDLLRPGMVLQIPGAEKMKDEG